MTNDTRLTLRVPKKLKRDLEHLASTNGVLPAEYMRTLLRKGVKKAQKGKK
jgi:predicted DNA binding CopG/RHH family protein